MIFQPRFFGGLIIFLNFCKFHTMRHSVTFPKMQKSHFCLHLHLQGIAPWQTILFFNLQSSNELVVADNRLYHIQQRIPPNINLKPNKEVNLVTKNMNEYFGKKNYQIIFYHLFQFSWLLFLR